MTVVGARDVGVRYGDVSVLNGVTLEVHPGEWLSIIGPNGAGKTTFLRAITGLVPYSGTISLDGDDARSLSGRERARRVAVVPQRPVLPPAMTVLDYALLGRTPHIRYFDIETKTDVRVVEGVLERLEISTFAQRPLGSLSGGEQQRVVLARALAQQAPTLLLDEGTSALDIGGQQQVLELVDSLRRSEDLTVVSAMHDLTLAGEFSDTLALFGDGTVVARGTPRDVLQEDLIEMHYGVSVRVTHVDGSILVSPIRATKVSPR